MSILIIKNNILVVFIDYNTACDTLKHDTCIEKLSECGIQGGPTKYLVSRERSYSYVVRIGDIVSKKMMVDGIAQGSVVGPVKLHYLRKRSSQSNY